MPVVSKSGCGAEQRDVDDWASLTVTILLPAWKTYPDLRSSEDSVNRSFVCCCISPRLLFVKGACDPISISFFLSWVDYMIQWMKNWTR